MWRGVVIIENREVEGVDIMVLGRPRKSIAMSSGKIGKELIEERKKAEEKLKVGREGLIAPSWFEDDEVARAEFERIVRETEKIGILDSLDMSILVIYCKAYSQYVRAELHIAKFGETAVRKSGGIKFEVVSPHMTIKQQAIKTIMTCSSKLGLATTDRLRLVANVEKVDEKENKFLKFLN